MTSDKEDFKDVELVEEGIPADNKSDAGSATTAPSVESGDSNNNNNKASVVAEANSVNRARCWILIGAVLILIGGAVTAAAVLAPEKKTSVASAESSVSMGGEDEAPPMFTEPTTFDPPFEIKELPLFGKEALEPYQSREELEEDLTTAAKNMVNKIILQNLQYQFGTGSDDTVNVNSNTLMEAAIPVAAAKQATQKKVAHYQYTNNQEKDADEADYIKTDGQYVYASYGDYLVVWDLDGQMVTQVQMPASEEPKRQQEDDMFVYESVFESMSSAYVESIQLTDHHVMVVVGGVGHYQDGQVGFGTRGTHVRVYNKPTADQPTLELVATKDIHGYFYESKYLEDTNSIHIISGGDFDSYTGLVEPLEVFHFPDSTAEQYYELATKKAADVLIPNFVRNLADFFVMDGQTPSLLKINSWRTEHQSETEAKAIPERGNYYGNYDESVRSYLQISSIAVGNIPTTPTDTALELTTTGLLGPSAWGNIYATDDSIVTHLNRYDYNEATGHSEETLFLLHFKVATDTGSIQLHTTHSAPGHLNSLKSLDIVGNDLRVAITHQKWTPLDNVWPNCGDNWFIDDSCMTEENWGDCFDVAISCRKVKKIGCPYTFECDDDDDMGSSTDNSVSVFDISQPGEMKLIGSVRIGDPHEVIVGVHFERTFAYANTFDERDPFYVLKLEQGMPPVVSGELKLDGFATYLQPISNDGSLILGIGQNVTGEGLEQSSNGLLVSVFDVSNPAEPKALTSQMLTNPNEVDSFSDAEWNSKSVQYNNGVLVIPVILMKKFGPSGGDSEWIENEYGEYIEITSAPKEEEESDNFEGFIVFDVTNVGGQGLREVARIGYTSEPVQPGINCNYCNGNLYRRSFLFDDMTLMTVFNSDVQRMDLSTGEALWTMDISLEGEAKKCCY